MKLSLTTCRSSSMILLQLQHGFLAFMEVIVTSSLFEWSPLNLFHVSFSAAIGGDGSFGLRSLGAVVLEGSCLSPPVLPSPQQAIHSPSTSKVLQFVSHLIELVNRHSLWTMQLMTQYQVGYVNDERDICTHQILLSD